MSKQSQHWEKTRGIAFCNFSNLVCILNWAFSFGAEMAKHRWSFGYPLTYWFTCQGSLGIFVILIFWFANRQEKIDEEFGYSEKGG